MAQAQKKSPMAKDDDNLWDGNLFGDSDPVVMTEKDAVKCKRIVAGNPQAQYWVFPVAASLDPACERWLLEKLGGSKAA